MRRIALLLALLALPAQAQQDSRLNALQTGDAGRGWEAVGRLNMAGVGFCTATLIAPDRVLTAAHCLFDRRTGEPLAPERLEFLAGWRTGRAEAIRGIARVAISPQYVFVAEAALEQVSQDVAVLELDRPLRTTAVTPFALAARPAARGESVAVVSYARERAEAPSLQDVCHVLDQRPEGVTLLSCDIDYGASGSPVFRLEGGVPQIVSVISARVEGGGETLSLGMNLAGRVEALQAALDSGVAGAAPAGANGARRTARFVRP